jgi:D-glycero-alpha-D-manno-heptose-7-phosphate kinase
MFSICEYFGVDGLSIDIKSSSPPRSALGGSSVAAVALVGALMDITGQCEGGRLPLDRIVLLAYAIESSVLRVPCGMQDQLAAAYGGVNAWCFNGDVAGIPYKRRVLVSKGDYANLEKRIMAAYCGEPHESVNINGKWVEHFMKSENRSVWHGIMECSNSFAEALMLGNYEEAARWMNRETDIRMEMTPDVLDSTGKILAEAARKRNCGFRFTGAGGGGCVWALGEEASLALLRSDWSEILGKSKGAGFLDTAIDADGLRKETVIGVGGV